MISSFLPIAEIASETMHEGEVCQKKKDQNERAYDFGGRHYGGSFCVGECRTGHEQGRV